MNVGSLFSGIGGLDAGLAQAGHRHLFLCEIDPYRRRVLRARFPGVPIYDDVRDVPRNRAGLVERDEADAVRARRQGNAHVDLLAGGFPCQDVSIAGQRAGLAGERSGLFYEFARVADALRPGWLLIENVPGLFSSHGGRDFGAILGTLADLGYGVAWRILDSRFFGVPQRRRRVFIVGAFASGDPRRAAERAGAILAVGSRCKRHPPTREEEEQGAAHVLADGTGSPLGRPLGSLADGGYRTTDLDGVPAFVSTEPMSFAQNQRGELVESPYTHTLPSGGGKPGEGYAAVRQSSGVRRLTPVECERLQALPDGWTDLADGSPDSARYSALGDAVTVTVAHWIGRRLAA